VNPRVFHSSPLGLPQEAYEKHRGKWIALSAGEGRVIAASDKLDTLEEQLVTLGEDPQNVLFDYVEEGDVWLGGAELA
jgi:hypothetical protein